MNGPSMSSDFGLRGPKTTWVCPSDRQLALRAKLRTGWSVKTNQFNVYPKPQPLTEKEQLSIVSVIKRAEELEFSEQHRVGKLVDRLESLRRLANGNGISECVLCGDSFGISVFGRNSYRCSDCKKKMCSRCVVDLSAAVTTGNVVKESVLRLCKLCSENREFVKKSGAWFYKGVPKYILPEKKHHYSSGYQNSVPLASTSYQEQRYISRYITESQVPNLTSTVNKRAGGVFWTRSLSQQRSQSEVDFDSSSGDEQASASANAPVKKKYSLRIRKNQNSDLLKATASSSAKSETCIPNRLLEPVEPYRTASSSRILESPEILRKSFERLTPSDSAQVSDNNFRSRGSSVSSVPPTPTPKNKRSPVSNFETSVASTIPIVETAGFGLGVLEVSLLFDDSQQALHCSLHKAKDITPTDINGLTDPYLVLNLIPARFEGTHLRTKTVHKTLQPVFNETLTFYGVTQNDMARQSLQINVMDEDRWGKDCLGSTQIPLHRIKSQETRFFTLGLEKSRYCEKDWGRGRLLLSLSYVTEKSLLLVGVIRAQDLPALDSNGTSDPFVKVRLLHDSNMGNLSSNCYPINKKYKTSVKWKCQNPEFREEFSLKVSLIDLPRLVLAISVWDKDLGKRNDYIGGLLLSSSSKGERLKHWTDMLKNHCKKIQRWHILSPSQLPL